MLSSFSRRFLLLSVFISFYSTLFSQENFVDFCTIQKSGTVLIYAHSDDDLIWMLPFWKITEKFIGGAMPKTPSFQTIINQQQTFINNNGYNINYASNWLTPWGSITQQEYEEYYWRVNPDYQYIAIDHLRATWWDLNPVDNRKQVNI